MSPCSPKPGSINPALPPVNDLCSMLPYLKAAWLELASGRATASISDGDRKQTFQRQDADKLWSQIVRLEQMCPRSATNPNGGPQHGTNVVAQSLAARRFGRW